MTVAQIQAMPMQPGVYSIFCCTNRKFYVGSSVNVQQRVKSHYKHLTRNMHQNTHLQAAWIKYGISAFRFKMLEICTIDNVRAREQVWLDAIKEFGIAVFNKHFDAGGGTRGYKFSEIQRARISTAHRGNTNGKGNKGRRHSLVYRTKMSYSLRTSQKAQAHRYKLHRSPRSLESRAKMSAAQCGRIHTIETKIKLSAINRGKTHSLESKTKMSKAHKGKTISIETRAKISAAQRGKSKKWSNEARAKLIEANRSRVWSKESRDKIATANRGAIASPETRNKISRALLGNRHRRGKISSIETRAKLSAARRHFLQSKKE
jgi:group I intron endonuclease